MDYDYDNWDSVPVEGSDCILPEWTCDICERRRSRHRSRGRKSSRGHRSSMKYTLGSPRR